MARHSSQTDKLLCCQSDHQTKHIVRVINGKEDNEKKCPHFISMVGLHQMLDAYFFSTQLLYNYPHLHAMLLNHPN